MIIYSSQYISLIPQKYLEINTFYRPKSPKLLINNLENNKKIIISDKYINKAGELIIRIFNFQPNDSPYSSFFPNSNNVFVLEKGKALCEIFELE